MIGMRTRIARRWLQLVEDKCTYATVEERMKAKMT